MAPLHARTHPTLDVEGCFACKVAGIDFRIPSYMSSKEIGGMSGIDQASAHKLDIQKALREDKEGRLQRAR